MTPIIMNAEDIVWTQICRSDAPLRFSDIMLHLADGRTKDRALQSLRRRGHIKYLNKEAGGPGWVRAIREML